MRQWRSVPVLGLVAAAAIALQPALSEPVPARPGVSLSQTDGAAVRVLLPLPADREPVLYWGGTGSGAPYRLAVAWSPQAAAPSLSLPAIPPDGMGPLQAIALREATGQVRLELELNAAVQPHLRRGGDSWMLLLEPFPPPTVPAGSPPPVAATATVAGTSIASIDTAARLAPPSAPMQHDVASPLAPPRRVAQAGRSAAATTQSELLLLDLNINNQRLPDVVRAQRSPAGLFLLPLDVWTQARLTPPGRSHSFSDGTPAYAVDDIPGATYRIDRQKFTAEITAPAAAFVGSAFGAREDSPAPPPRPHPGFLLNYDLSIASASQGGTLTSGATLEAIAFNGFGNLVTSVVLRRDSSRRSLERLDTFWRYDMPERLETLVVGDTIGTGGGWSRPVRYGGVRWGRDFGQRPGFVTFPQLMLTGEAALPSTVEVLVNNARQVTQQVQPGPFELSNVPIVTGAGEINLVVRDLLGRETVVRQSYYASPRLLAPGLTDFSLEAGRLRFGYGQGSHYADLFGALTWRQGLSSGVTGEARLELQSERRAAGLEMAGLLGDWAVGRIALATSSSTTRGLGEHGGLMQLGIERNTQRAGGSLQYEYSSRGFAPFGEAKDDLLAMSQRARERWLASMGGPLWGHVSGGVSYVSQTRWDGERVSSLGLSLSMPVGQRASLSLSTEKRLDSHGGWRGSLSLSLPLDNGIHTASRLDRASDGRLSAAVSAARNAPAGPGLGWYAEASTAQSQRARGGLQYNTSQAESALEVASDSRGQVASRATARGSLGLLAGLPFASRPVGQGSFAVVEVEGMVGVPIKRSHQVVAETDANGRAFIPGLLPWQRNRIEVDPANLPLDTELGDLVREVIPYAGSGSILKFAVRRTRQALVVLHQREGVPVPVGTRVRLMPDGPEFLAGRRGEVWLTDLAAARQLLEVSWPGGACKLELAVPASVDGIPAKIGPVTCGKEDS